MRIALLSITIAVFSLAALVRPRWGLYAYVWYTLLRPDVLAFVENQYPFSVPLAVATSIGALRHFGRLPVLFSSQVVRWFLVLQFIFFLSYVYAIDQTLSTDRYLWYLNTTLILLLIPLLIETEQQLRTLIIVMAMSVGVLGVRVGIWTLAHGGVLMSDGYGGQFSDNNLLALGLAMTIPLAWYGRELVDSRLLRVALLAISGLCAVTVIVTTSRGGSLSLGLVSVMILMRSKRRIITGFVLIGAIGVAIFLVRNEYLDRMATLSSPTEEASAASRIDHARVALKIAAEYPLIGVGFGGTNYLVLAERVSDGKVSGHVAHNTYLQVLVDSGVFALLAYVGTLGGTLFSLGKDLRLVSGRSLALIRAIQTSIAAFALGSTFYSCQLFDFANILLFCAACVPLCVSQCAVTDAAPPSTAPYVEPLPSCTLPLA